MTVNLLQIDSSGEELIQSLFQSPEDQMMFKYLAGLECTAPGVTIFTHRLSDDGFYLCTVPTAFQNLVALDLYPPRLCGCPDCSDMRLFRQEYWAWSVAPELRGWEFVPEEEDALGR